MFQVEFAKDNQKSYAKIKCNPFTQQELTAVNDTGHGFDDNISNNHFILPGDKKN